MLSVCIVNWNTRDLLRECLASLEAYPPENDSVETIVVDNASTDGSAEMVRAEFPGVCLIASESNLGYAAGNNCALEAAEGDLLLLLNPDVLLNRHTLTNAIAFLHSKPDAGAVGIRQIEPGGATQRSVRGFPTPESVMTEALGIGRLFPRSKRLNAYRMSYFDYSREGAVDQPMGTFLLFPREVYEVVGGMDTRFPIFFNDVDWCFRVRSLGWRIYYTPSAEITHYGGASTGKAPRPNMIRESHESLIAYFDKHQTALYPPQVLGAARLVVRLGTVVRSAATMIQSALGKSASI